MTHFIVLPMHPCAMYKHCPKWNNICYLTDLSTSSSNFSKHIVVDKCEYFICCKSFMHTKNSMA